MKVAYNTIDEMFTIEDLKHAFIQGAAVSALKSEPIIHKEFNDYMKVQEKRRLAKPGFEDMVRAIADIYDLDEEAVRHGTVDGSKRKLQRVADSRFWLCWFSFNYLPKSVEEIRDLMWYKNHASVIHGKGQINIRLASRDSSRRYAKLCNLIKASLRYDGIGLEKVSRLGLYKVELV